MDDVDLPDHQEDLSKEDLEVLQTFYNLSETTSEDSLLQKKTFDASVAYQTGTGQSAASLTEDEMLALFATEADEDITTMRSAVQQLEQDNRVNSSGLKMLKRRAHKVAGTAAAIGCDSMSTVARHIEVICKLVEDGNILLETGLIALIDSVRALDATLQSIVSNGYESKNSLLDLEEEYKSLHIDLQAVQSTRPSSLDTSDATSTQRFPQFVGEYDQDGSTLHIDVHHFNSLLEYSEKMIVLDTSMENAQKQVETALNELQFAQARLRRLEPLLSSLSLSANTSSGAMIEDAGYPPSSLVARIFQEASERTGYVPQTKNIIRPQPLMMHEAALWDEMEIDRFSETNVLAHSFTEAITDVALATTHLRQAFIHLKSIVAQQMSQASTMRNEAFLLQSLPLSVLVTRLREAVEMLAGTQSDRITFEVSGEKIEIAQDVLEIVTDPLVELVQLYVADSLFFTKLIDQDPEQRIHLTFKAHTTNNEATIEIGFSQSVPLEAITLLQDEVHHVYGSVNLQKHATGRITLQLRLPRSRRMIQGLLVRSGSQHVIVSVSQVRRIYYSKQGIHGLSSQESNTRDILFTDTHEIFHLDTLWRIQTDNIIAEKPVQTALELELDNPQIAIVIDEVVKELELVMKPLPAHLCRPGIANAAVDGNGNMQLVLNLPELIKLKEVYQQVGEVVMEANAESNLKPSFPRIATQAYRRILIADDSVYIRQSLHMSLSHEGYEVLEAVDGLQTLDQLSKEAPDLLLLDIEMPYLNGYDVLSIIRTHHEFSTLKIIMLTSRSSEKHIRRAMELGAHSYLTKPCQQDVLLKTIKSLLGEDTSTDEMEK